MNARKVYAVIENIGGYKHIDGSLVKCPDLVSHYLKAFESNAVFVGWIKLMQSPGGGHVTVIAWWFDKPPCKELAALKRKYKETWINAKR